MTTSRRYRASTQVRSRLSVELGTLKLQWATWCAQRGVTPSEELRRIVAETVRIGKNQRETPQALPACDGPCERVSIGLTDVELDRVRGIAYVHGFTPNRWIVALVRAQLTGEPQLSNREMILVAESNKQLATIRTLLSECARGAAAADCHKSIDWEQIRTAIEAHMRTVAKLLRSNLDRWSR